MGDENPIRTLGNYSKPSHEGYRYTIELLVGNNVVPLRSDTIQLVKNGCSFHELRSEDPNQHLKDFLKLVDSLDLDGANKERTRLQDLALYDNESWNDPRDFAKLVKAISLPQDVSMVPMTLSIAWKISNKPLLNMRPHVPMKQEEKYEVRERDGNPEDTDTIAHNKEQRDTPQLELKDTTAVDNLGPNMDDEGIEWLDVEEPLDLVDTSKESVYESLFKEMPKCSLNYDFRIKKGDPRNLKIPCMIGHKFIPNTYIDINLLMNIMSLAYYNSIRKNGYEYRGRNFIGLRRDMHVFVGNMSYVMDFTILEKLKTNIDPSLSHVVLGRPFVEIACLAMNRKYRLMTFTDEIKQITFKTPYKDPKRSEPSSEGHDLLSFRIIHNEDDYDRGCKKPSDLEDEFYKDT
ncbi:hypothetical protein Tco_0251736, partial [Tanacetum coccineum]